MKKRSCTSHKAEQGSSVTLGSECQGRTAEERNSSEGTGVKTAHTQTLNYEVTINWPSKVFQIFCLMCTGPMKLCLETIISSNMKGTGRVHSLTNLRSASILCYLKCILRFQKLRKREKGIFSKSPPLFVRLTSPHLALYISHSCLQLNRLFLHI